MTLPVTALLPLALALLLISALGFDLLRRLGNGRKPRAEGLRRPPGAARGTRPARQGEAGGSRRPASGPSATGQHRRTLAAPPCPPTATPSPGALAGPRGGAASARPDDPRAAAAARTARRPLETVDLPLDLPVMPQTAAAPPGRADRPVRARAEGPAVPPTTAAAPGPEVGRQAATTPVATARGGATPTPTPPPHWRPPPRANDSRFDSRWNSSLLDSRWLNLSVRASDATPHDRRRPAAPVLPFHRRQPGAWSLAAAGQGVQPTLDPRWDEGPARSDAGPQTLPLRRAGATQRRQPPR